MVGEMVSWLSSSYFLTTSVEGTITSIFQVILRFNKPIIADIVGEAASSLLEAIEDSHRPIPLLPSLPVTPHAVCQLPASAVLISEDLSSRVVEAKELPALTSCRIGKVRVAT